MTARARPPFDAELEPALEAAPAFFTTLEPDSIAEFRAATTRTSSSSTTSSRAAGRGHRSCRDRLRRRRDRRHGAAAR